jgi:hypothetical protein
MMSYLSGKEGYCLAGAIELPTIDWTLTESTNNSITTNSSTGGNAARMRGPVSDATGTVTVVYDDDIAPEDSGITDGALVVLKLKLGESDQAKQVNAIIDNVTTKSSTREGVVEASFTFSKASGAVTVVTLS